MLFPPIKALWRPQTMKELDAEIMGEGMQTLAGVNVDQISALNYSAVFSCIRVRAETLSQISLHLYRPTSDGKGFEKAKDDPRYRLVHDRPNKEMTSVQWLQAASVHHDSWGSSYGLIDIPQIGRLAGWAQSIYPLKPERTEVYRDDSGKLRYKYTRRKKDGTQEVFDYADWQILHVRSMSLDGVVGLTPIGMARQAIGLGLATEEFGARFFGQGTNIGAVLTYPANGPTIDQVSKIEENVKKAYAGLKNSHALMVLSGGPTFTPIAMPLEDAQFLATRKFQLEEVCRIYRVPPHLVGNLDKATFSNIEQQSLEFAQYTMTPYCRAWEQELNAKLLTDRERAEGWHFEFDLNSLVRGDIQTRYNAYKIAKEIGLFNANELRAKENENPREGGDQYWDQGPNGQGANLEPVKQDANARLARVEQQDIIREAEKRAKKGDEEGFHAWLKGWLNEHETRCEKVFLPYYMALNTPEQAGIEAKARVERLKSLLNVPLDGIRAALEGME